MSNSDLKFIILDDHPLVCETLAANVREQIPESSIAYLGPDPLLALNAVEGSGVWIALVDADLGQSINTSDVIISFVDRGVRVALVSAQDKPQRVQEAVLAGARAFVPKREISHSLKETVEALRDGRYHRTPEFLSMLVPTPHSPVTLTESESRALIMIAAGMPNASVARRMDISSADVDGLIEGTLHKYIEAAALAASQRRET